MQFCDFYSFDISNVFQIICSRFVELRHFSLPSFLSLPLPIIFAIPIPVTNIMYGLSSPEFSFFTRDGKSVISIFKTKNSTKTRVLRHIAIHAKQRKFPWNSRVLCSALIILHLAVLTANIIYMLNIAVLLAKQHSANTSAKSTGL